MLKRSPRSWGLPTQLRSLASSLNRKCASTLLPATCCCCRASVIVSVLTSQIVFVVRAQTPVAGVRAYRSAHEAQIIGELVDLLSIPNVASDTVNIRRNAAKLIEMMGRRGIEARLLEGSGPP